jgi:hypothetical protein
MMFGGKLTRPLSQLILMVGLKGKIVSTDVDDFRLLFPRLYREELTECDQAALVPQRSVF